MLDVGNCVVPSTCIDDGKFNPADCRVAWVLSVPAGAVAGTKFSGILTPLSAVKLLNSIWLPRDV